MTAPALLVLFLVLFMVECDSVESVVRKLQPSGSETTIDSSSAEELARKSTVVQFTPDQPADHTTETFAIGGGASDSHAANVLDQLQQLGQQGGFLPYDSKVQPASDDLLVVRDKSSDSVMCLSSRGKYRVSRVKPTCEDDTHEFHKRACYKKCSILTDGQFPLRTGMTACARQGCDWDTEELWNAKCRATCASLTQGRFPRRVADNACAKCLVQFDCPWYKFWACYSVRGLLPGHGYNVGGDGGKPQKYTQHSIRASFKQGRTAKRPKCIAGRELLLQGYCHRIVPCPETSS